MEEIKMTEKCARCGKVVNVVEEGLFSFIFPEKNLPRGEICGDCVRKIAPEYKEFVEGFREHKRQQKMNEGGAE